MNTLRVWAAPFRVLLFGMVALGGLAVALMFLEHDPCPEPLAWLSWAYNTYPACQSFEIREEGEHSWFGSIKVEYDLDVMPGQYICVKVDADNARYGWQVMVYYDASMFSFGMSSNYLPAGEWACGEVLPWFRAAELQPGPYTVYKVHWCGFGRGGVVATPTIIVSNVDLSKP